MIQKIKNSAFARNSIIVFAGTMVINLLSYVFHLALGRLVSVTVYGEIESLLSFMTIISVPSAALGLAATRFSAAYKARGDKTGTWKIFDYLNVKVFYYGLPFYIVSLLFTPFVAKFLNIESYFSVILVFSGMFLSFLLSISGGIISGWQKFNESNWLGIIGVVVKLIFSVAIIKIGFALDGAIGGYIIGAMATYFVSILILKYFLGPKENSKSIEEKSVELDSKSLRNYIIPAFFGSLALNIFGNIDMVLAKHNLDSLSAGQYGALTIVSKIIFFATSAIGAVLFSMAAEDDHKNNDTRNILRKAFFLLSIISIGAVFVYFIFPNLLMGILFGSKYKAVSHYLGWFSILVVLFSFTNIIIQYLLSIHRTKFVPGILIIMAILILAIEYFGNSILSIVSIMIAGQIAAIVFLSYYLYNKKS
jgi:O-antigen/teichoic acid export membrane protein